MTIVITAFERSPDGGKGLARDTRVRWALEELGLPYDVRPLSFAAKVEPAHLAVHPFGLIPTYEDGDVALFESGSIIQYLADRHGGLFPDASAGRARAITWMFAAVGTLEPPIFELSLANVLESDKPWADERLLILRERADERLGRLADHLGDRTWLDDDFTAGDLMIVSVLVRAKHAGLLDGFPNLAEYVARAEARPAYQRAFAAQLAQNTGQV